ncbi:MAG: hypothetical protein JO361_09430 [Gammaproteobacteria bacterium]|nr:hypothetical protein [Gammaproteobacteria bacterium]
MAERRQVRSLRELPQAIEPGRDLWPEIEARIGARPARWQPAQLRWLAAAAMVASVAVGVWIGRSLLPGGPAVPPSASIRADGPLVSAARPGALDVRYERDPRYQRERAALLRSLQAQLETMPPATRAKVVSSLETIEHAKQDLEQALGRDPGNALLQELLIDTYQDEMRVLTDVHEAGEAGRGI